MEAVIKVGGSLGEKTGVLKELGLVLNRAAKQHRIVVVPGGGKFADTVRELDAKFGLPAAVAHKMAILAMDQYGFLLEQVFPDGCAVDSLKRTKVIVKEGKLAVFLPSKLMLRTNPFFPSWDVTSDSIAAYVAAMLESPKLILVTDVDGIFSEDPKTSFFAKLRKAVSIEGLIKEDKRTSVDKFLPHFLSVNPLDCYVINGNYPERIQDILSHRQTICTRIH